MPLPPPPASALTDRPALRRRSSAARRSRDDRHAGRLCRRLRGALVAHQLHRLRAAGRSTSARRRSPRARSRGSRTGSRSPGGPHAAPASAAALEDLGRVEVAADSDRDVGRVGRAARRRRRRRKTATARNPRPRSVRAIRTAISPRLAIRTRAERHAMPVDRAGDERVRAERSAEHVAHGSRRPRAARARSIPVSIPISWSIETRSSVAMLPVAPAGHRAAAELAEARLERRAAGLQRGQHVGESLAARVVEVRGQLDAGQRLAPRRRRSRAPGAGSPSRSCRRSRSRRRRRRPGARRSRTRARAGRRPRRGSRS